MMDFPVPVPLSGGALDRSDPLRRDAETLERLRDDPATRLVAFWRGKPAIAMGPDGPRLALTPPAKGFYRLDPHPIFLGRDGEAARFAVDLSAVDEEVAESLWPDPPRFIDFRAAGPDLTAEEAGMAVEARSLLEWRRTHQFCAQCGARTEQAMGGWRRDCPSCGAKHFPRTDPVVIMLVVRPDPETGEDRVVLGRQPNWPPGLQSLLAGYVEAGETLEAAVRRETLEEAGLEVGRVAYLASQPWPFPSSLMIGCYAEALGEELTPDLHELESCRWFTKSEVREALAGRHPEMSAPRTDAIAWALIKAWAEDQIPSMSGGEAEGA